MSADIINIAVIATSETQQAQAAKLAEQLHLPLADDRTTAYQFLLAFTGQRLELRQVSVGDGGNPAPGPVYAEFIKGPLAYRRRQGTHRQPLARAIGLKADFRPLVIDATAGLGRDGFVLACLGCQVHLIERSPVIAALLADGLQRAAADPFTREIIQRRLALLSVADSTEVLKHLQNDKTQTVIYLDPMYPHRTKSSLVKKEMRQLRAIVGDDRDAADLLQSALAYEAKRVVVKRPLLAPCLAGPTPDMNIKSKKNRFDVYLAPT